MRIFKAFLIIMASTILFLLPLTAAVYDFKTDQQADTFSVVTGLGETTETIVFSEQLYDEDTTTINIISDLGTDSTSWGSYNATPNNLLVSGLTANTTRTLTATYDIDALDGSTGIINLADRLPWIWLLLCIAFAPAALAAIFTGRA